LTRNKVPLGKAFTVIGRVEEKEKLIKQIVTAIMQADFAR